MRKILYSPGYGAGWSSWNSGEVAKYMLTYQPIIDFIEAGNKFARDELGGPYDKNPQHPLLKKLVEDCFRLFGETYVCTLGADNLVVVNVSGQVRIDEYDGYESYTVRGQDEEEWM